MHEEHACSESTHHGRRAAWSRSRVSQLITYKIVVRLLSPAHLVLMVALLDAATSASTFETCLNLTRLRHLSFSCTPVRSLGCRCTHVDLGDSTSYLAQRRPHALPFFRMIIMEQFCCTNRDIRAGTQRKQKSCLAMNNPRYPDQQWQKDK